MKKKAQYFIHRIMVLCFFYWGKFVKSKVKRTNKGVPLDSAKAEILVRWFLRFNGYFTVENFIAHDARRIYKDHVGCSTEFDLLAIRLPHSREIVETMPIINFSELVDGQNELIDVVIAEVKTGSENKPNKNWKDKKAETIEYALRFIGCILDENEITNIANELLEKYLYKNENYRYRYLFFAEQSNSHYQKQGVQYILYDEIIDFFIQTRGPCWKVNQTGVQSIHQQWDPVIIKMFDICNDVKLTAPDKKNRILSLFQ